jgi:hypothetical protein
MEVVRINPYTIEVDGVRYVRKKTVDGIYPPAVRREYQRQYRLKRKAAERKLITG